MHCPYGHQKTVPVEEYRALGIELPAPRNYDEQMAYIGEYVFLPYEYMGECDLPWYSQSKKARRSDSMFLPRSAWTVETVHRLVTFRPKDYSTPYRQEIVPRFLARLCERDPELFAEFARLWPALAARRSHIGRKAILQTLNPGVVLRERSRTWVWDGQKLTAEFEDRYWIMADYCYARVKTVVYPLEDFAVIVRDEAWVGPQTRFIS